MDAIELIRFEERIINIITSNTVIYLQVKYLRIEEIAELTIDCLDEEKLEIFESKNYERNYNKQ